MAAMLFGIQDILARPLAAVMLSNGLNAFLLAFLLVLIINTEEAGSLQFRNIVLFLNAFLMALTSAGALFVFWRVQQNHKEDDG